MSCSTLDFPNPNSEFPRKMYLNLGQVINYLPQFNQINQFLFVYLLLLFHENDLIRDCKICFLSKLISCTSKLLSLIKSVTLWSFLKYFVLTFVLFFLFKNTDLPYEMGVILCKQKSADNSCEIVTSKSFTDEVVLITM